MYLFFLAFGQLVRGSSGGTGLEATYFTLKSSTTTVLMKKIMLHYDLND
jgi:hypothetical protein